MYLCCDVLAPVVVGLGISFLGELETTEVKSQKKPVIFATVSLPALKGKRTPQEFPHYTGYSCLNAQYFLTF